MNDDTSEFTKKLHEWNFTVKKTENLFEKKEFVQSQEILEVT